MLGELGCELLVSCEVCNLEAPYHRILAQVAACSCGDLDGEASLIVARRAPLVVAVGGSALSLPLR